MITWIRGTGILLLVGAVAVVAPSYAAAQPPVPASGAVLYEMTENLSLKALQKGQRRATSQLLGVALPGTPLCPATAVNTAGYCVINATGSDNINLNPDSVSFGKGNFGGTFTVVVPGDNPTDGPELVVGRTTSNVPGILPATSPSRVRWASMAADRCPLPGRSVCRWGRQVARTTSAHRAGSRCCRMNRRWATRLSSSRSRFRTFRSNACREKGGRAPSGECGGVVRRAV